MSDAKDKLFRYTHFPLIGQKGEQLFRWSFDRSSTSSLQAMAPPRVPALHLAEALSARCS